MTPTAPMFQDALERRFQVAAAKGQQSIDVRAGDLHQEVGNYPKPNHRMPTCCSILRSAMRGGDVILSQPLKGNGASLTIRYQLPRSQEHTSRKVSFDTLTVGAEYDRTDLAAVWGYEGHQALGRGIVTPAGEPTIVLFVTERQQLSLTQYANHFDGETLWTEGESSHRADQRLMESAIEDDEVHLFHRASHHSLFTYIGRVFLLSCSIQEDSPSRFIFSTDRSLSDLTDEVIQEETNPPESSEGDPEGMKRWRLHLVYERSRENRRRALEMHKPICDACGFDFNLVYGKELANSFIQVHHRQSITTLDGSVVNPETDLVPLCANCHCMVHRKRGEIIPVEELKEIIERNRRA